MKRDEKESVNESMDNNEGDDFKSDVDLFGNKRRLSKTKELSRRVSLGLPDNGSGLTKDYYNIDREMSITSLVELIVKRRAGSEISEHRPSRLSEDLTQRIKKTLTWKTMEDELNKEDVMVNFRKKMRQARRVALQSIPKEAEVGRKINEERRIHLRTSIVEPMAKRNFISATVKDAIQEFRLQSPSIITESHEDQEERNKEAERYEPSDILVKTKELLEKLGYIEGESKTKQPPTEKDKRFQLEDSDSQKSLQDKGKPVSRDKSVNKSRPLSSSSESKKSRRSVGSVYSSVQSAGGRRSSIKTESPKQPSLSSGNSSKQSVIGFTYINAPTTGPGNMSARSGVNSPIRKSSKGSVKKKSIQFK